jgi:hypothetical protein
MKRFIRKFHCKTPSDCLLAIKEFHKTITPEYCQNYINKLKEVNKEKF